MEEPVSLPDTLSHILIRHLEESDLRELEWNGEFRHFRKVYENAYVRMLTGKLAAWVVVLPPEGVIGQAFVQFICDRPELANGSDRAYMYSIRIKPQYRSLGIGTMLMTAVEKELFNRGIRIATLNVAKDNPRAQQLYERLGFRVTAHESGVWSYPDENGTWHKVEQPAWRMEKILCQG